MLKERQRPRWAEEAGRLPGFECLPEHEESDTIPHTWCRRYRLMKRLDQLVE
jgi:hypothetical protein